MGPWLLEIQQCGCVKDIWNMSWVMVSSRVPSPLIWVKFSCSPGPVTSLSVTASRRTCDVIGRDSFLDQTRDRDAFGHIFSSVLASSSFSLLLALGGHEWPNHNIRARLLFFWGALKLCKTRGGLNLGADTERNEENGKTVIRT